MDWTANVAVHESASPSFLRERILTALAAGCVHPSLIYSGLRQTSLWIALHRAFSPAHRDESCLSIYENAFQEAVQRVRGNVAHVVSLACGDGSKDVRCLKGLRASERAALYTPVDISLDLALTAARAANSALPGLQSTPLLCDLPHCSVLPAILKGFDPSGCERILLFLGTIHNYWPPEILRSILYPLRSQDQLLLSANLAPAGNYEQAVREIASQYDNEPTRRWLMGALSELDLTAADGDLGFEISESPWPGLKKIEAFFTLRRERTLALFEHPFNFRAGARLSVFFSHRFTVDHIHQFLAQAGLSVIKTWADAAESEGLFLCQRAPAGER